MEALERTGKTLNDFPFLKTIHSICYHQLGIGRDQIVRPETICKFGGQLGVKITGATHDPWIEEFEHSIDAPTRDDFLIQANHSGRHRKIMLRESMKNMSLEIDFKYATWFTNAYRDWKKLNGLLDYTDLLSRYVEYGRPLDIEAIFVDEAQDLSPLQWDAVFLLGANARRWYIAGDDDQAIFHWAGADSNVFQDLKADKVEILSQSYRLSVKVHELATRISTRMHKRLKKDFEPTKSWGSIEQAGYLSNIDYSNKTFILFRNHYRGADIARTLKDGLIPFLGKGSPVGNPDLRIALLAFYKLIKKGEIPSDLAKKLSYYLDPNLIRPKAMERLEKSSTIKRERFFARPVLVSQWSEAFKEILPKEREAFSLFIEHNGFIKTCLPTIEVMSIHQSKGREAHTVIIDPEMSKASWNNMILNPDDEHRVQYVAVTRAKERVMIMLQDGPYSYKH